MCERSTSEEKIDIEGYLASLATIKRRQERLLLGNIPQTYTESLLADQNKRVKKLGSETVELVREECRPDFDTPRFLNEAADLVYSTEVLVIARDLSFISVLNELARRNQSG